MTSQESISDHLRQRLRDSGLTQRQLAQATGVSLRAICDFLGGRQIRSDSLDRIGEAMGAKITAPKNFRKKIQKRADSA